MATTYTFGSYTTSVPGVYSRVDTSGLTQPGLTPTGIVALIGTAEGGKPYTAISSSGDFVRLSQASQIKSTFKSGDLLEAANIAFDPSSDSVITGGAQQVVAMKMNPSTQGQLTLQGAMGPVLTLTSQDYGEFVNHIGVQVAKGSVSGYQVSVTSDDVTETADNLGGAASFSLSYNGGSHGWTTMSSGVNTDGTIYANGSLTVTASGSFTQPSSPQPLLLASDASDQGLPVYVFGVAQDGSAVAELLTLSGNDSTSHSFQAVYGVAAFAAANNKAVVLQTADKATTVATLSGGAQFLGVQPLSFAYVAQTQVSVTGSAVGSQPLMLVPQGNPAAAEMVTLNGQSAVLSVASYPQLQAVVTGGLGGQSVTVSAPAVSIKSTQQTTVNSVIAYFDARSVSQNGTLYGFDASLGGASASAPTAQLDARAAVSCLAPAEASFSANLYAIVNWLNGNSVLVSAAVPQGAMGAPSVMAAPSFLSGGGEGVATFQDYQNCLNLLQDISVDCIVNLSCDPAQAAALDAHIALMNSPKGNNERNGFVGVQDADLVDLASKSEFLAQAQALNTRNLSALGQGLVRYNSAGTLTAFNPAFLAVSAAGMQAGAKVGTSLTHKYVKAVSITTHPSWSPTLDAEDMIQGGTLFLKLVDGKGYRFVRDVTTYLQDQTLEFVERSINVNLNYIAKNLRTACDFAIGLPAFAGTESALASVLKGESDLLVTANVMTNYQPAVVTLEPYGFDIQIAVAPTRPTNFIGLTLSVISSTSTTQAA